MRTQAHTLWAPSDAYPTRFSSRAPPTHNSWYQCPEFGYDLKNCVTCDGPKARCVSHYSLPFRCESTIWGRQQGSELDAARSRQIN